MLNLDLIQNTMSNLGLSQAALAERCKVSREAVSNWLSGQSMPRPNKLKALSDALELEPDSLIQSAPTQPEPVVAGRTRKHAALKGEALDNATELARQIRELVPFARGETLFAPPALAAPQADLDYARNVARHIRARLGVNARVPLRREHLLRLHQEVGSVLVPVLWPRDKSGYGNAISVYLPDSKTSWVIFSLHSRNDDFHYLLAHELANCYALHALRGEAAASFAEYFARELLFPRDVAGEALDAILASKTPAEHARSIAAAYDISVATVVRQADHSAQEQGRDKTGLDPDKLRKAGADAAPSVTCALFGNARLSVGEYITGAEELFKTPAFEAIAQWQQQQGERAGAFIAGILNIRMEEALALSNTLFSRGSPAR